jgi:malonyl-CoA O-methyltransferase
MEDLEKNQTKYEENPFEDERGAAEWIKTVENEQGTIRDKEIYPQLAQWIEEVNPGVLVDIGSGQGICSTKLGTDKTHYIGVDPSHVLTERAQQLYQDDNREFVIGNAYDLPIKNESADACLSITTWFHLADLDKASRELARVLRPDGKCMIITPNPAAYDLWESFYSDTEKEGNMLVGKVQILLNPEAGEDKFEFSQLSRNTLYLHTLEEIINPLKAHGIEIDGVEEMGELPITNGRNIFIKITGHRKPLE